MPTKNQAYVVHYYAYNKTTGDPVTGDVGNQTTTLAVGGGGFNATTNTPIEIGSGTYAIQLTAGEMNNDNIAVNVASTGTDVRIDPTYILTTDPADFEDANVVKWNGSSTWANQFMYSAFTGADTNFAGGGSGVLTGLNLNTTNGEYTGCRVMIANVTIPATPNDWSEWSVRTITDHTGNTLTLDRPTSPETPTGCPFIILQRELSEGAWDNWDAMYNGSDGFNLGTTTVDSIWHRLRGSSAPPSGSYGHYLDANVSAAAGGGGSSFYTATGAVINAGTEIGTYTNTTTLDGVYHEVRPGVIEIAYEYTFQMASDDAPNMIYVYGRYTVSGNRDAYFYAWDYQVSDWQLLSTGADIDTMKNSTVDLEYNIPLPTACVDASGNVRVRLSTSHKAHSSSVIYIDYISVEGLSSGSGVDAIAEAVRAKTVNRDYNGIVWIDTVNGSSGTNVGVDGTARQPVNNLANAKYISDLVGGRAFHLEEDSVITLDTTYNGYRFHGGQIDLGGQNVSDCQFEQCTRLHGSGVGFFVASACTISDVIGFGAESAFVRCVFKSGNALTPYEGGTYIIDDSTGAIVLDCVAGGGTLFWDARDTTGNIVINNAASGDVLYASGNGGITINPSCNNLTVYPVGFWSWQDNGNFTTIHDLLTYNRTMGLSSQEKQTVRDAMVLTTAETVQTGSVDDYLNLTQKVIDVNTAVGAGGGNNTIQISTPSFGQVPPDGTFVGTFITLLTGSGEGQTRYVTDQTGDTLTVNRNWTTKPNNTTNYMITGGAADGITSAEEVWRQPVQHPTSAWTGGQMGYMWTGNQSFTANRFLTAGGVIGANDGIFEILAKALGNVDFFPSSGDYAIANYSGMSGDLGEHSGSPADPYPGIEWAMNSRLPNRLIRDATLVSGTEEQGWGIPASIRNFWNGTTEAQGPGHGIAEGDAEAAQFFRDFYDSGIARGWVTTTEAPTSSEFWVTFDTEDSQYAWNNYFVESAILFLGGNNANQVRRITAHATISNDGSGDSKLTMSEALRVAPAGGDPGTPTGDRVLILGRIE